MTCACGCGKAPTPGRRFVHGHNNVLRLREHVLSHLRIEPSGCLIWMGKPNGRGYAHVGGHGRRVLVHRLMYEWFVGPIPDGLQIDHLCRNRMCAAPAHLEAVTQRVNILRGTSPAAVEARMDSCRRGHPFDLLNTYWRPDRYGRMCRACLRARPSARRGKS